MRAQVGECGLVHGMNKELSQIFRGGKGTPGGSHGPKMCEAKHRPARSPSKRGPVMSLQALYAQNSQI